MQPINRWWAAGLTAMALSLAAAAASIPASAQDDWQAGGGENWERVLAAARQEGKVVVAGDTAVLARPMAEAFKRDTGITMEFLTGRVGELFTRLDREVKSGNVTMDVSIGGGSELKLLHEGYLVPIKPQLMLPQVTDPKYWIDGKMRWLDKGEAYMFQGSNWVHGWPIVNSKLVDPKSLHSWKDLLKPEFKGKIAAADPRGAGPGQAAAAYLAHTFGIEFVKLLYSGQNVTYTRDNRQLVDWVARGNYAIGLGSIQSLIELFKAQGMVDIAVPEMADGPGSLLGGFSVSKQAKGVPHPNAATVFHNWYASRPGQEVYVRAMLEPSTRVDVKVDTVPAYVVPKPGVTYLDQYEEEWYVNQRPKVAKAIIEALGGR